MTGAVIRRPLPLAPRPHVGESLSSWASRLAARYDLAALDLAKYLLGRDVVCRNSVERLDYQANPGLEAALARAASIAPARLRALRIVGDDRANSCWHRMAAAWCPACIQDDLVHWGEVHQRAIWRLGCCVLCPDHGVPLRAKCRCCQWTWGESTCHFWPANGRLELACRRGHSSPDLPAYLPDARDVEPLGALPVEITPALTRLVSGLQHDLLRAMRGLAPERPWGATSSAAGLLLVVRTMAFSIVLGADVPVEQRVELLPRRNAVSRPLLRYDLVTPAAMTPDDAFGALAIVGAVLDSLEAGGGAGHRWKRPGGPVVVTAASFAAWLPADGRSFLQSAALEWEPATGDAFQAVMAKAEGARR